MKTTLLQLVDAGSSGVFRCHAPLSGAALERAAQTNLRIVVAPLGAARDKNAFLKAMARALKFPEHFGYNWDAFYDCLLEMQHGASPGTMLVLREASAFARGDADEFAAAVDTLSDAARYWEGENKVLLVVAELEQPALAPDLLEITRPAE